MSNPIRIALVGDYHPDIPAHVAIPHALELATNDLGCAFEMTWMLTVTGLQPAQATGL